MDRKILLSISIMFCFSACTSGSPSENQYACPVTTPSQQTSTLPVKTNYEGRFWYGTPALWTNLPNDGVWWGLPRDGAGYGQKTVFWREGYVAIDEPNPELTVSGRRLDSPSEGFSFSDSTNGWDASGDFMLLGISVPTKGCWEITATYKDVKLTYVVEVVDER